MNNNNPYQTPKVGNPQSGKSGETPIIIIGNGIAGVTAAREIRKLDSYVPILIISGETDHHFSRSWDI